MDDARADALCRRGEAPVRCDEIAVKPERARLHPRAEMDGVERFQPTGNDFRSLNNTVAHRKRCEVCAYLFDLGIIHVHTMSKASKLHFSYRRTY